MKAAARLRMTAGGATSAGLVLGYAADRLWGDPHRGHPVAVFGRVAGALESATYRPNRRAGVLHVMLLVGPVALGGHALERLTQQSTMRQSLARCALTAVSTWAVLGGRSLEREAEAVEALLRGHDLAGARQQITHLVGRDPSQLDEAAIARACVESVAENTADAVVAPLVWGAIGGMPGLWAYRAINTLDAMVGHRSERYLEFGWAAARLDDAANWLPARLTVALTAALAPVIGGDPREVCRVVRADAAQHPSPNAGPVEAAAAGALRVQLGGTNTYEGAIEDRGTLGHGPAPTGQDIARARGLAQMIGVATIGVALLVQWAKSR